MDSFKRIARRFGAASLAFVLAAGPIRGASFDPASDKGPDSGFTAPNSGPQFPAGPEMPGGLPGADLDQLQSDQTLDNWIGAERSVAIERMFMNISPSGAAAGAVTASPSTQDPNYWYNWRRDAALTMTQVGALYKQAKSPEEKAKYLQALQNYAAFVRKIQKEPAQTGLGEPKYNLDGSAFNGPWGRPQDDGPAEEASALIYFASTLLDEGKKDLALELYGDSQSGVKADLDYLVGRGQQASFDVWEEEKARHFDTSMAQRTAFLEGAWLAETLGDSSSAEAYRSQARTLEPEILRHWNAQKGYIVSALDHADGLQGKSGLDSAVVLSVIHASSIDRKFLSPTERSFFAPADHRVLATAHLLKQSFQRLYPINQVPGAPGTAVGRYPEDRYFNGNPWVLSTNAFAQLHYAAAKQILREGGVSIETESVDFFNDLLASIVLSTSVTSGQKIRQGEPLFDQIVQALKQAGDAYLARVRYHANADGSLSEQMSKDNGYMMSARDLTWNYASFLAAVFARDTLEMQIVSMKTKGS